MGICWTVNDPIKYKILKNKEIKIIKKNNNGSKWYNQEHIILILLEHLSFYYHVELYTCFFINKKFNKLLNDNPWLFRNAISQFDDEYNNNDKILIYDFDRFYIKYIIEYLKLTVSNDFNTKCYLRWNITKCEKSYMKKFTKYNFIELIHNLLNAFKIIKEFEINNKINIKIYKDLDIWISDKEWLAVYSDTCLFIRIDTKPEFIVNSFKELINKYIKK